eukprot:GHVT01001681.1.p1 GENE.GHVT01001681.1~~GHVT01001681.1.p1  ORF type:complete len:146 (-),score=7.13 GHVT01001681.1:2270-2707(-)
MVQMRRMMTSLSRVDEEAEEDNNPGFSSASSVASTRMSVASRTIGAARLRSSASSSSRSCAGSVCATRPFPEQAMVIYHKDDRAAAVAATKFVNRGYIDVMVLTGGLEVFEKQFPNLVETGPSTFGDISPSRANSAMRREFMLST